jgi:quinolinate synthase
MTGKQAVARQDQQRLMEVELEGRIASLRVRLGEDLLILGHHYQSDAVIGQADLTGDSLKLAQQASRLTKARYIVFCGVAFMAETASILAAPGQSVHLPSPQAGCPMADMVALDELTACWRELNTRWGRGGGGSGALLPITYVNSSAQVKAFCGRHGGVVCTSANAPKVLAWALDQAERVLFMPDQHLGRNTAQALGLTPEEICLWDHKQGKLLGAGPRTRVVLWSGYCPVHVRFSPMHIDKARREHPGVLIMVHPECPQEVVAAADSSGSTEQIISTVSSAPAGSTVAVGTEINLVRRLALRHRDKTIIPLAASRTACPDMARTNLARLLTCLEGLPKARGLVTVQAEVAAGARLALERMLLLT